LNDAMQCNAKRFRCRYPGERESTREGEDCTKGTSCNWVEASV
jgi:hypothetical protein